MAFDKKVTRRKATSRLRPPPPPPSPVEDDDPLAVGDNPEGERVVDPVKAAVSEAEGELDELLRLTPAEMSNDPRFQVVHRKGVVGEIASIVEGDRAADRIGAD